MAEYLEKEGSYPSVDTLLPLSLSNISTMARPHRLLLYVCHPENPSTSSSPLAIVSVHKHLLGSGEGSLVVRGPNLGLVPGLDHSTRGSCTSSVPATFLWVDP